MVGTFKGFVIFASKLTEMSWTKFLTSKLFFRQLTIAAIGFGILLFLAYYSLGWLTNHDERIEVPNLEMKNFEQADELLNDIDLELVVQDSAEYNPEFPKGAIIKQMPLAGDIVKSDRKIYVTMNAMGYKKVTIPEFLGKTRRNVESTLNAIGIEVSEQPIYIPDLGKDVVRGMKYQGKDVKFGDKLPKTSKVTLVLGKGAPEESLNDTLSVPNSNGTPADDAIDIPF